MHAELTRCESVAKGTWWHYCLTAPTFSIKLRAGYFAEREENLDGGNFMEDGMEAI